MAAKRDYTRLIATEPSYRHRHVPSRSSFTALVGCELPLQLAVLGGVGTPALAAAVADAGGLGMMPGGSPDDVDRFIAQARGATRGRIGVGFLMPFVSRDAVAVAGREADVVEFFYGDPDADLVSIARKAGAGIVSWQTGSAEESAAAVRAGCDFVVVQGIEAGGHVRGKQRLDEILRETLRAVDVPVVAAGGIGTAERTAELLAAGAGAVRVGTRFLAASECDAHPRYVEALIAATGDDTELTTRFDQGWPDAPHRVLRSAIDTADRHGGQTVATRGDWEIPLYNPTPPSRDTVGDVTAMAMYAGTAVGSIRRVTPAADIVRELMAGIGIGG